MNYQRRLLDGILDALFDELPAILIDGPKGVGKTTTAQQRAKTIRRLDDQSDLTKAEAHAQWLVEGQKPILIDEWQRYLPSWDQVKRAVDQDFSGSQFLLTGSMPFGQTHSGAARITSLRMRPLAWAERQLNAPAISIKDLLRGTAFISGFSDVDVDQYCSEIVRSGFPGLRKLSPRPLKASLDGYIQRIVDADLREMGLNLRKPASMLAWMRAYAAATATTATWESIRDAASAGSAETAAKSTVIPYRDALTRLRILDELEAWHPTRNQLNRVRQAPKHFLADPALAVRLLNIESPSLDSVDGPLLGQLFEALVSLSLRTYADANFARSYHFRDAQGRHEIDFMIEREDSKLLLFEVKFSTNVSKYDFKHLDWMKNQLGEQVIDKVVIYAGNEAYRHGDVAVIPLALLNA